MKMKVKMRLYFIVNVVRQGVCDVSAIASPITPIFDFCMRFFVWGLRTPNPYFLKCDYGWNLLGRGMGQGKASVIVTPKPLLSI